MELGQIEAFERTAREGNFTRAAESLGLTQPAVSARITTLEAELGGKLFKRTGRNLTLTPLGERFLPHARRMLAALADGLQELKDFRSGKRGEVKIAAPAPFVLSYLVHTLAHFRDQHPAVDILIRERDKRTIFSMLHDNVINLGLVSAPVYDRQLKPLAHFRDPIRPCAAPTHPLASFNKIHMQDLHGHTVFRVSMFPQMTAFIDTLAENAREGSGGAVIAIPMIMALQLVILGQGVSFLPESYLKPAIQKRDVVILDIADMPQLYNEAVLVMHRERTLDHVQHEFIRILKAVWRNLLVH
ncbi:MAG: LysR family transcriptional regulator [Phototrophicales bacterium]